MSELAHPATDNSRPSRNGPSGFRLPLVIIYMIVAFNITAFTVILQLDWLIFNLAVEKVIAWTLTTGSWMLAYLNRNKFASIF